MKTYIGTKIISAEPMNEMDFAEKYKESLTDYSQDREGYHVVYPNPNGTLYHSWSPKEVFELAYREVSYDEEVMVMSNHIPSPKTTILTSGVEQNKTGLGNMGELEGKPSGEVPSMPG